MFLWGVVLLLRCVGAAKRGSLDNGLGGGFGHFRGSRGRNWRSLAAMAAIYIYTVYTLDSLWGSF